MSRMWCWNNFTLSLFCGSSRDYHPCTDLCGRVHHKSHFDYIINPIHRNLSAKLIIKLKLVTEVLDVMR